VCWTNWDAIWGARTNVLDVCAYGHHLANTVEELLVCMCLCSLRSRRRFCAVTYRVKTSTSWLGPETRKPLFTKWYSERRRGTNCCISLAWIMRLFHQWTVYKLISWKPASEECGCWISLGVIHKRCPHRNQSGYTGARDREWQWHQLGYMQSLHLDPDNHASMPPLSFFYQFKKLVIELEQKIIDWSV